MRSTKSLIDRRHHAEQPRRTEARRDRRRGGLDRGRRVPPRTSRLIRDPHIHPAITATATNHARSASIPRRPRGRSQPPTVAAVTRITAPARRCPNPRARHQRSPNSLRRIRSAQQHRHRQQNVRRPTGAAPSPPRTKRILQPIDPPSAGMTPIRQAPRHRKAGSRSPRPPAGDSTRTGSTSTSPSAPPALQPGTPQCRQRHQRGAAHP